MELTKLLPMGTVVYLNGGKLEVMIVSRQPILKLDGHEVYFDYAGISQILGLDPEQIVYFNQENIKKVIFKGYESDNEERLQEAFVEWRENHPEIPKGKVVN
ncbi:DUF4176 domain-containing protein [Streptococcus suis]|uniref:DUF4176 domain-containing protein n=1 Tax=Streptococcus suis TaxID=1307 RepID=UPI000410E457|nr:DUF4176 domain-containing protein [Streptococcus suis]NQJ87901.1 DUF4176 domain-containing protein [Streptococcus suis]NQM21422.1 DUF4176 domain-containing protein [Streptococcus suis]NQM26746.1 DUF4176 domain-containing protein [Streptococcus suis]HEM2824863.1 DUF4176 domain-containing protein [Streptococcus suis]HEM2835629.1 DUF4176 domain-containing protein [Streptococcus suis]